MSYRASLANCEVFHARTKPEPHTFRYKIGYFVFETRSVIDFSQLIKKRFHGILGFRSSDYLGGEATSFDIKIREYLAKNCNYKPESVRLMTLPRMFGYGFNPISFWLCYRGPKLDAVLCEVNNTFGERHCYWIPSPIDPSTWIPAQKVFHVSPFFPVDGFYEFRFNDSPEKFQYDIRYKADDGDLRLVTYLKGSYQPVELTTFIGFQKRYGWISVAVIARIHFQAINLWRKKASFFRKPPLPTVSVTSTREDS